ncbi:MAG: YqaJ viral recombinase family protein [Burkholderiaceae bacterium]|nr:YqaJ viral recombinase family protein [Burkholderiaceae bacterium]
MNETIVWDTAPQGSEAWLALRARGFITGSKAKDARDKLKNGAPSGKCWTYAYDTARQREGGTPLAPGQNTAMRMGQEQEPIARMKYEARTGELVEEVGFAYTMDGKFGCSLDGLVGADGAIEVKTMVGSTTLFEALVGGDISEYRDQCLFAMWLLRLQWVDVVLWAPDLDILRIIRVTRDEAEIEQFEADMLAFDEVVENLRKRLRAARAEWGPVAEDAASVHVDTSAPAQPPAAALTPPAVQQAVAPDAMPELF